MLRKLPRKMLQMMPARNLKSNPILFTFFLKNFTDFDNTVIDSILNHVKYTVSVVDIVKSF